MTDKTQDPPPNTTDSAEIGDELGAFGELEMSEEEAALARSFAEALDAPPPVGTGDPSGKDAALEAELAAVALVKTGNEFELNATRQTTMKAEALAQFDRRHAQTQQAGGAEQKSRWWRWLSLPVLATAGAGAFALYVVSVDSSSDMAGEAMLSAARAPMPMDGRRFDSKPAVDGAPAFASPPSRLLQAQADALAAATLEGDVGNARRALDSELADYRSQMIASLEVKYR